MAKKLYIKTYGCQMNVYDSERMADILSPLGYELTSSPEEADLAILNTCHIREKAEQKMYSDLGRLKDHRKNQDGKKEPMIIAVGGCVAQAEGAEIMRQAPFVDMVFGPQTYHRLPEMIARATRAADKKTGKGRGVVETDFPMESKFDALPQTEISRAAAFLTVQEGCDKFCSYCVVPYTRGAEFSRPVREILEEARHLVQLGTKEITLLGQNVNAYHGEALNGSGEWGLGRLARELGEIQGLERIRYITSHPSDMTEELIEAHRDVPQLMPYLHLPIQAGSNRVLEAMNRKHTRESYLAIMERLREARPDIALASDFIVGFPGETDAEFRETLDIVEKVRYAQAYSFKYSIRPGTPAGVMENQVPEAVKAERLQELQALLNQHQHEFNTQTINKTVRVLLERKGRLEGQLMGRSPYMQSVAVFAPERLLGQIVDVEIKEAHPNSIAGTILTTEIASAA
ncbi:tRNA (N6-isopentenyl adenosine(37)-C2)-methylthiotransferase MiaB [Candidatus Paracaedibacter symbiosus]|uniref:tRNA (N6-isopentenyl adenosine(37)-C2)-methylthiotransferase MiaB n=1 Tax=Candidatus Paracaedibacter symbiosus TaxID=244582 RepID=UPI00050979AA|nr:tRNA (N6-isopentenyl adenosine(37)-C2)-methylthiotransferase MiaB [Candidatus Paracaedibacter symbiosus]